MNRLEFLGLLLGVPAGVALGVPLLEAEAPTALELFSEFVAETDPPYITGAGEVPWRFLRSEMTWTDEEIELNTGDAPTPFEGPLEGSDWIFHES